MQQDYQNAFNFCDSSISADSSDIDAHYLKLVTFQSQLADYESYALGGTQCMTLAESTLAIVDKALQTQLPSQEILKLKFYKGNVLGILGIIKTKSGGLLSSLKDARASLNVFKSIEHESELFPDILYGVGLFDYYIGDNLKWIPGLGKKAQSGLKSLYSASKSNSPFRYAVANSLLWILIERKEFRSVDSITALILKEYPENTLFLQIKARSALGQKDYKQASDLGKKLIDLSYRRKPINWSEMLSGYQLIALCLMKQENKEKAKQVAQEALSFTVPTDTLQIQWVQKHREYLLSIK